MIGCPYDLRPSCENTLMVDNNPSKNILNLISNYIVCPMGMVRRSTINFHGPCQILLGAQWEQVPIPQYVWNNRIGDRYMDLKVYVYRELWVQA